MATRENKMLYVAKLTPKGVVMADVYNGLGWMLKKHKKGGARSPRTSSPRREAPIDVEMVDFKQRESRNSS